MSEEIKEQKIDLKDRMLSDDDLNQVSGGSEAVGTCVVCGKPVFHSCSNLCEVCWPKMVLRNQ